MLFLKKNLSLSFVTLIFISFSFVMFAFVSEQTAFADGNVTEAICGTLCKGTSCGMCVSGTSCDSAERVYGNCTDKSGFVCCVDKNYTGAPTEVTACGTGGTCGGVGTCSTVDAAGAAACSVNTVSHKTACCKPAAASAAAAATSGSSCPGGTCKGGACLSTETAGGACSAADGGGTCCKSASAAGATQSIPFANPLAFNTVEEVLTSILGTLQGIIVVLALVFIVIGAVLYITSAGNEGQMTLAKGAITAAMIGLAIALAAPSFLKEIGTVLGWGAVGSGPVSDALTLSQIALNVLNFLLSIVGVLAVIMLVIGGIMYLTAAGNEDRIETGKKIVTYSIIGITVALAALIIVRQIAALFV